MAVLKMSRVEELQLSLRREFQGEEAKKLKALSPKDWSSLLGLHGTYW